MENQFEAQIHEETKLWNFVTLFQGQIKSARRKNRERNLTCRNSRGDQLQDTFRALPKVHFIHPIYCFEAWEVRSPTLRTVCKSELKWKLWPWEDNRTKLKDNFASCKITNSTCEIFASYVSTCEIHMCNPKYLRLTLLDIFFRYFV